MRDYFSKPQGFRQHILLYFIFPLNLANVLKSVTIPHCCVATILQKDNLCGAPDCHL